ncbi:hypothetical protein, partial [Rickettsia sp. TH2014]|uniref:hypothetical protein n=1 Tax=Rickettsia sp. TH2014 TaxID=1967503 RepID=UPI001C47B4DF
MEETEIEKKILPFHNKVFSLQVYKKLQKLSDDFSEKKDFGHPPQKQSTKGVEFSRNKGGDSINDNIK